MTSLFSVSLKAIIRNKENKFLLLIKDKDGKKYWDLPGGRIEGDDSFEETLNRELKEEIGLSSNFKVIRQIGECWELPQHIIKTDYRALVIFFEVYVDDMPLILLSKEHNDFVWMGEEGIKQIESSEPILFDGYQKAIKNLFS